jgi:hypothetical protein
MFFFLCLVPCTFCSGFNGLFPRRIPLHLRGLSILIVNEVSKKQAFAAVTVFKQKSLHFHREIQYVQVRWFYINFSGEIPENVKMCCPVDVQTGVQWLGQYIS